MSSSTLEHLQQLLQTVLACEQVKLIISKKLINKFPYNYWPNISRLVVIYRVITQVITQLFDIKDRLIPTQ